MPFQSRRRRRARPMSKSRRAAGPKALKMVRKLDVFVDKELHYADFLTGGTSLGITTTTTFNLLTAIQDGTGPFDRTGEQCTLRNLAYKMLFITGNTDSCVRVTVFRDKQANGDVPISGDLYQNATDLLTSPMNAAFTRRFRILQDYYVSLSTNWRPIICVKKFRRLGTVMRFSGAGFVAADIVSGGIWMALTSNTGGGGANPTVDMASRIRFAP